MSKQRVIIDTDPGLDDAVAILFALSCGQFDVLGLTTVAGNIGIKATTHNSLRLLAAMGREDIPVVQGADTPLRRESIDIVAIHGQDGVQGLVLPEPNVAALPEPSVVPHHDAVGWLAQTLLGEPAGSLTILALGPMTNLAKLIKVHPEAASRIGRIIAMGGAVDEPGNVGARSEFNFATDPEAAHIVFRAGIELIVIPLDVTRKVRVDIAQVELMRGTVAGDIAADVITLYFGEGKQSRPLHDPCVMLYALQPDLFTVEERLVAVDLEEGTDAGALKPARADAPVQHIAMRVDSAAAIALLTEGLRA